MNVADLIRPHLHTVTPYRSARHDFREGILLDANENAFGSPVLMPGTALNRYPDPLQHALRKRLASLYGADDRRVFVGVGSDEAIDLLIRVFCEPGRDGVLIAEPTYGMYRVASQLHNVRVSSVLLDEHFRIDTAAVLAAWNPSTKMIFCCSPNNPTGNTLDPEAIRTLCDSTGGIVVVDEAYIEFAGPEVESMTRSLSSHPNLVVLRTLSKAWGMAGIRLGVALAHPDIVDVLLRVKAPYNVNALTAAAALEALDRGPEVLRTIEAIRNERTRLAAALADLPVVQRVFPSQANFLLVRFRNARSIHAHLTARRIIVRDRSAEPRLDDCLRITVGTPEENTALITALYEISA